MGQPEPVRYLRSEPTMAFPRGRLLAQRGERIFLLATDGWIRTGRGRPPGASRLSRKQAETWCAEEDLDAALLDDVPAY
ncbi:hypothetical protein [Gandjariella thermophila]|nr:hypothetical protein [Gandjariella thermophila]